MADKPEREALVFYADSRFERLARRPGAVAREQALANAQSHVDDLKSDFLDWLDQELQQLRAALAQIEVDPSDMTVLDRANNNSSQLRDIGTTMGFELVTFVAGSLCAMLDTIKAGAAYDKDMIDCHINALFLVKTEPYRNLSPHQVPEMSFGLRRIVELAMQTTPEESGDEAKRPAVVQILLPEDDDSAR
jgi:chemotaxis protein histidine kinase CheA